MCTNAALTTATNSTYPEYVPMPLRTRGSSLAILARGRAAAWAMRAVNAVARTDMMAARPLPATTTTSRPDVDASGTPAVSTSIVRTSCATREGWRRPGEAAVAECVRKTAVTRSNEGRPVYIRAYTPAAVELASHTELLQPHGASMRPELPPSESAGCPAGSAARSIRAEAVRAVCEAHSVYNRLDFPINVVLAEGARTWVACMSVRPWQKLNASSTARRRRLRPESSKWKYGVPHPHGVRELHGRHGRAQAHTRMVVCGAGAVHGRERGCCGAWQKQGGHAQRQRLWRCRPEAVDGHNAAVAAGVGPQRWRHEGGVEMVRT